MTGVINHVNKKYFCRTDHESKIDVDEMTVAIKHQIAIMPVLDLQKVCHETVSRTRLDEILLGFDEFVGKGFLEEFGEGLFVQIALD